MFYLEGSLFIRQGFAAPKVLLFLSLLVIWHIREVPWLVFGLAPSAAHLTPQDLRWLIVDLWLRSGHVHCLGNRGIFLLCTGSFSTNSLCKFGRGNGRPIFQIGQRIECLIAEALIDNIGCLRQALAEVSGCWPVIRRLRIGMFPFHDDLDYIVVDIDFIWNLIISSSYKMTVIW